MTAGTHQARRVRRLRSGAYTSWVICDGCDYEMQAWNEGAADRLVGQHNRTPNEPAEEQS